MEITDVIRQADSDYVVFFLLAAYIETLQFGRQVPDYLTQLPINGFDDLNVRFANLAVVLDLASTKQDVSACMVLRESLQVFGTALNKLRPGVNAGQMPSGQDPGQRK
jgi:hypothetical protein